MSPSTTLPTIAPRSATSRVAAIDVVRGLAMVIMALDHIREFWSLTPVSPEDMAHTTGLLFFTRWITHFCAPTFVFLAGASVYLYQQKQPSRGVVSRFLLTRGLWLILLELVVINFLLHWGYSSLLLQVIWAIGWGMVVLAGLIWLPRWLVAALALGFIAGQHLLPATQPITPASWPWAMLYHAPFVLPLPAPYPSLLVAYLILPWVAVLAAGYVVGPWFKMAQPERVRWLRGVGVGLLVLFMALRATNWYGDPAPWSPQPRGLFYSILSFINVSKYPPSLLFLSLTLGGALLLLSIAERLPARLRQWLDTYGRVPLFYYLLHFCLISGGAFVWTWVAFGRPFNLAFAPPGGALPAGYQPSLLRAYVVWAVVVALLYWPCRWYQAFKQRHTYWWLSYL